MFKRIFNLVACLAMMLPVCGAFAADGQPTQSAPADLARLIPEQAVMIAYTGSMNELTKSATDLVSSINPQMAMMVAFAGPKALLSQQISTQNKMLDDGAVAFVTWPSKTLEDVPYWAVIFGVENASSETVRAKGRGNRLIFLEGTNWVALTNAPKSWTPLPADKVDSDLVDDLLNGQVAVRLDLEKLVAEHGDEIRSQLQEQVADADLGDAGGHMALTAGHTLLFTTRRWDLGLAMNGGNVDLAVQYLPKDDSPMAIKGNPAVAELSNRLPSQLPLQMVMDGELMRSFVEGMLKDQLSGKGVDAAIMTTLVDNINAMCEDTDGGMGLSMGMSEHGPNMVKVFKVKDVAKMFALTDAYVEEANKANMGMQLERMPVLIGGDSSRAYRIKIDAIENNPSMKDANLFGPDGLILRIISNKNMMAVVIGDPKLLGRTRRALEQASSGATVTDSIVEHIGGEPAMTWSLDLRQIAVGLQSWLKGNGAVLGETLNSQAFMNSKIEAAPPVMIQMGICSHGEAVRFEAYTDVAAVYSFSNGIAEQAEAYRKKQDDDSKPKSDDGG